MTSITLRKRKLVDVFDKDLELEKMCIEPKTFIDRDGKKRNYIESILPRLRDLFPTIEDSRLKDVLVRNRNDIIGSIEDLKLEKKRAQLQANKKSNINLDPELVKTIINLKNCNSDEQAYSILSGLKTAIIADKGGKEKLEAENKILKQAYKIERGIGLQNKIDKEKMEQELTTQKNNNQILLHKLMHLESAQNTVFNRNSDVF